MARAVVLTQFCLGGNHENQPRTPPPKSTEEPQVVSCWRGTDPSLSSWTDSPTLTHCGSSSPKQGEFQHLRLDWECYLQQAKHGKVGSSWGQRTPVADGCLRWDPGPVLEGHLGFTQTGIFKIKQLRSSKPNHLPGNTVSPRYCLWHQIPAPVIPK